MDQTHLFLHTSLRLPRSLSVCQDVHLYRIEFVVFSAKVVILFTIFLNYLENYNVFQMSTHIHQFSSVQLLSRVRLFVMWTQRWSWVSCSRSGRGFRAGMQEYHIHSGVMYMTSLSLSCVWQSSVLKLWVSVCALWKLSFQQTLVSPENLSLLD